MSQSHPHRTWLQRMDHSEPNSGSDSAKEKTRSLASCDDPMKAQLLPCTHPLRPSITHQPDSQSLWPLLGVHGKALLEAFGSVSLNLQQRERELWFEVMQKYGWLTALVTCRILQETCMMPSNSVRQIFFGCKSKVQVNRRTENLTRLPGGGGVTNP